MDSAGIAALITTLTAVLAAATAYAAGRAPARAARRGPVDAVRRQHQREAYAALATQAAEHESHRFRVYLGGLDKPGKEPRDRAGFSWDGGVNWTIGAEEHMDSVGSCMAPAAFAPVTKGGFRVRHADLPLWPTG
ncbi:hypothetical protein AB0P41_23100 [Streptomyces sp. NPDC079167]|uniref:hypothetical protein n=1 Tax=Streptomyces sp. NPDC079167 TaxID=3154513 RepID=UPI0034444B0D